MNWSEYQDEVDYATYSLEDDKLRIYSGRVITELYEALKNQGWNRAYKQGCFFAKWSPTREDTALALCDEIVDEDTSLEERAEARAERFEGYSENAAKRSRAARDQADSIASHIPLGQPILIGHHSEKRHRRDLDRIWSSTRKALDEGRKAERWADRAAAAGRRAAKAYEPGKIARRIRELESQKRKKEREWNPDLAWLRSNAIDEVLANVSAWDRPYYGDLGGDDLTKVDAMVAGWVKANQAKCKRWTEHYTLLILFWRSAYEDVTGDSIDEQLPLKKGGWAYSKRWGCWAQITRVNKGADGLIKSVSIDEDTTTQICYRIWDYTRIGKYSETDPLEASNV